MDVAGDLLGWGCDHPMLTALLALSEARGSRVTLMKCIQGDVNATDGVRLPIPLSIAQ